MKETSINAEPPSGREESQDEVQSRRASAAAAARKSEAAQLKKDLELSSILERVNKIAQDLGNMTGKTY